MAFGLWLNTTCHRQSPDMNQHWAIILAHILFSLLCGRSATEHSGGRRTVSSVLAYVEEGSCHWLLGVINVAVATQRLLSFSLMSTTKISPLGYAYYDSPLGQSVENTVVIVARCTR